MTPGSRVRALVLGLTTAGLVAVLGLLFVSVKVSYFLGLPVVETLPLVAPGVALVALGFLLRYLALRRLIASNRNVQWSHVQGTLVVDGVFRHSRNPSYLGILLTGLGALLIGVNLLMLIFLVAMFAVFNRDVSREEAGLAKQFGESYLSYKRVTRRWL